MGLVRVLDEIGFCGIPGGYKYQIRCDRPACQTSTPWVSECGRKFEGWQKKWGFQQIPRADHVRLPSGSERWICGECASKRDENIKTTIQTMRRVE